MSDHLNQEVRKRIHDVTVPFSETLKSKKKERKNISFGEFSHRLVKNLCICIHFVSLGLFPS